MSKAEKKEQVVGRGTKRWRAIAMNSIALLGALGLIALLGFVGKKQGEVKCHGIEVKIQNPNGHAFVSEKQVLSSVYDVTDSLVGSLIGDIDLDQIHSAVMENGAIRQAHVYTTIDGRLRIEVQQRTPIARIINQSGTGFYLDQEGFTMPLSDLYSADVPLFTGNLSETMMQKSILEMAADSGFNKRSKLPEILEITRYISKNEFWSAQVEHINVNSRGEFEIIPRVGDHRILLGDARNLENKFKKLLAFYVDVLPIRNLNNIKTINLKYRGQVVCEK